jgi:hypothetical protein
MCGQSQRRAKLDQFERRHRLELKL